MNVLIANNRLSKVGGTEKYTYALVEEFLRRGFKVEYYCYEDGFVSGLIEQNLGVGRKSRRSYDLILANHWPVVDAVSRYGLTIQTVHGVFPFLEQPSTRAHGYVSISREIQDYLGRMGIGSITILNGINCDTYKPINPLSNKLCTVLSMTHSEKANRLIEEACHLLGIRFTSLNKYRNPQWDVVTPINDADLVIGLGRSAYEAMACGRPVIAFDWRPYSSNQSDGYLPDTLAFSISANCSGRWAMLEMDVPLLAEDMTKYRPEHGAAMRTFAETHLNIRGAVDAYLRYAEDLQSGRFRIQRRRRYAFRSKRLLKSLLGLKNLKK